MDSAQQYVLECDASSDSKTLNSLRMTLSMVTLIPAEYFVTGNHFVEMKLAEVVLEHVALKNWMVQIVAADVAAIHAASL